MITTRNRNRYKALLLAAALLFTQLGTTAYADGNQKNNEVLTGNFPVEEDTDSTPSDDAVHTHKRESGDSQSYELCNENPNESNSPDDATTEDGGNDSTSAAGSESDSDDTTTDAIENNSGDTTADAIENNSSDTTADAIENNSGDTTADVIENNSSDTTADAIENNSGKTTADDSENSKENRSELNSETSATESNAERNTTTDHSGGNLPPQEEEPERETGNEHEMTDIAVTGFDELNEVIRYQTVLAGTEFEELTLPETLGASGYTVVGEDYLTPVPDSITIEGVTWELTEEKNGTFTAWEEAAEQGSYIFTPALPAGYILSDTAELPEIFVNTEPAGPPEISLKAARQLQLSGVKNGNGYTYDNGTLTIQENIGTTAWRNDGNGITKTDVTTVIIGSNVDSLGTYAFSGCTNLITVVFDNCTGLRFIEKQAFMNCEGLTALDFSKYGATLQSIGEQAFLGCKNLQTLSFSGCENLNSIDSGAFKDCTNLQSLDLSGCTKLKTIESSTFMECSSLQELDLSSYAGLKSIGDHAFYQCKSLQKLLLPDCSDLTTIGSDAFYTCEKLSSLTLSNCTRLTTITANAFQSCSSLQSLDLSGCTNLKTLGGGYL